MYFFVCIVCFIFLCVLCFYILVIWICVVFLFLHRASLRLYVTLSLTRHITLCLWHDMFNVELHVLHQDSGLTFSFWRYNFLILILFYFKLLVNYILITISFNLICFVLLLKFKHYYIKSHFISMDSYYNTEYTTVAP